MRKAKREKKQAEDESRGRATPIKNDSSRRARRGTARERRETLCRKRGETKRILIAEWSRKHFLPERSTIRAGRQGEMGRQMRGEKRLGNIHAP